jgi:hypothetical protein
MPLEDRVWADYTASYIRSLYLMIPTPYRLSVKILECWDFTARYVGERRHGKRERGVRMRALLCHCHHHLEAEDDDALCAVVREHLISRHPALEPSEVQVREIVSTRAYDIEYVEEEFAFEPY